MKLFVVVCGGLRWFAMVCGGLSYSHTVINWLIGSDYVSGARTNYRNSMCPASGLRHSLEELLQTYLSGARKNR